jgi:hypothetical protein
VSHPVPPDVERDIERIQSILRYLGLNELRLMACLDVIVTRFRDALSAALPTSEESPHD